MSRSIRQKIAPEIAKTAADWFTRLQADDAPQEEYQAWQLWLGQSKEHQKAYDEVERAWTLIGRVEPLPWATKEVLDAEFLLSEVKAPQSNQGKNRQTAYWATAAAVLLAATTVFGYFRWNTNHSAYSTQIAERRSLRLADGSRVTLGAQSKITPFFKDNTRRIVLDYGEAFFEVAHDPKRPFSVIAGSSEIRATGTAFNVRSNEDRVLVSVTEGRVAVITIDPPTEKAGSKPPLASSQLSVSAGEQAAITAIGTRKVAIPATSAVTWLQGRMEYRGEELQHVVDDLNRYTSRRIVLTDEALRTMRYSGTVFPDHLDEWLQGISGALPVTVRDNGEQREISRKP